MPRRTFGSIQAINEKCYRIYWSEQGERRSKTIRGNKKEASHELSNIEALYHGRLSKTTWNEYFDSVVTPSIASLAIKTKHEYKRLYNAQLRDNIGNLYIVKTTWRDVQETIDNISKASTQHHVFTLWRKIANMAIRDNIILTNPCARTIKLKRVEKKRKELLEPDEVLQWIKSISDSKYLPQLLIMLGGGLRHSEAMALTWKDIYKLESKGKEYLVVQVNKANLYTTGHGLETKETKTDKSTRHVVIGEPFMSAILSHRDKPLANNPQSMRANYREYCKRNGIKYIAPGHLRSNFAMLHAQSGSIDSLVSMAMGHSHGNTKYENYMQESIRSGIIIASTLEKFLTISEVEKLKLNPV